MRDLRYGFRVLLKSPAFTVTAILNLALCVGANTAINTVVDRVLLRPLPYPHPGRLAMITRHYEGGGSGEDDVSQSGRGGRRSPPRRCPASCSASPALRHLVWGVSVADPLTFAIATTTVLFVCSIAALVPALRIARRNPIHALRS